MSAGDQPLFLSRAVWTLSACGALAIHAGGVAFALGYLQPPPPVELGAPAIEIGVELASPHLDPNDLPVGPDTSAAAPAPEQVAQKAVIKQSDLPQAIPTETDDPDRVVSPTNATKPQRDDPKVAASPTDPSQASPASEESAAPSVDGAPPSTRSMSPSLGTGDSTIRERVTWQKELAAHFNKYKRYPAERAVKAAEVVVTFTLDRLGHVLSSRVVRGSGDAAFDQEALAMLQRADPVPPPPPLIADEGLSFTLPVIFHAKSRD